MITINLEEAATTLKSRDFISIDDFGRHVVEMTNEIDYLRGLLSECLPYLSGTELYSTVSREVNCQCSGGETF